MRYDAWMNDAASHELPAQLASFSGRQISIKNIKNQYIKEILVQHDLPEMVARLLAIRGIEPHKVSAFLAPTLRDYLPDPLHLLDMKIGAERLFKAIEQQETIAIFGDYDVDGATSTALLIRYLSALHCQVIPYIPDRITEGYGPNSAAMLTLKAQGASLIITVDCGTLAFEPLRVAHEAGVDVIVVDHHQGEARRPECVALINPNRLDETSTHQQLAAVGVTFLLLVAVHRMLTTSGFFDGKNEPNLLDFLDLVALGTVCDVVPLTGVNRAFVAQGIKVMAGRKNTGIAALQDVAHVNKPPDVYQLGFVLGPRINAGGRVGKADFGTRLLSTHDASEAAELAAALDGFNHDRRTIEAGILEDAMAQAESQIVRGDTPILVVHGTRWHPGVIGIVAGRIKERFRVPTAAIAFDEHGTGKASARSVSGFDFGAAVIAAVSEGLLVGGGGHAMAAGFTVEKKLLPALTQFFADRVLQSHGDPQAAHRLEVDVCLHIGGAAIDLVRQFERLAPFGTRNPAPLVMLENVQIVHAKPVGEDHLKLTLSDVHNTRLKLDAICFRCTTTPLGKALQTTLYTPINLVGELQINHFNGVDRVQLRVIDGINDKFQKCSSF